MTKPWPRIETEVIAAALGGPRTPPVDLLAIADELNVHDVRYINGASVDGATYFHAGGPVIYLGRPDLGGLDLRRPDLVRVDPHLLDLRSSNMWFTLAHELAHVMLRKPEVVRLLAKRGTHPLSKENEERLADRIAETLLIPDDWVGAIRVAHATIERLENVAHHAGVSMAILIVRLATAGKDVGLLQWQRGKHSWYVTDRPGTPLYLHGNIKLSEAGVIALDKADCCEQDIVADGYMGQYRIRILGRARRQGNYVTQLLRPSRDVWMAKQSSPHWSDPQPATLSSPGELAARPTERHRVTSSGVICEDGAA
jgi:hypothetical protein